MAGGWNAKYGSVVVVVVVEVGEDDVYVFSGRSRYSG